MGGVSPKPFCSADTRDGRAAQTIAAAGRRARGDGIRRSARRAPPRPQASAARTGLPSPGRPRPRGRSRACPARGAGAARPSPGGAPAEREVRCGSGSSAQCGGGTAGHRGRVNKRLVRSCRYSLLPVLATGCEKTLRSVANQLFLSSSSQQQRYSLMAVKNHRATQQQAC
jgi:hypothetical protein